MQSEGIAEVVVTGQVAGAGFEQFVAHYVGRLDLRLIAFRKRAGGIELRVAGAPELIDMLATACWLGPRTALVDQVEVAYLPAGRRGGWPGDASRPIGASTVSPGKSRLISE
jgi:acylphosphatase